MASYLPIPQWFNNAGQPLDSGKIYTYITGTSTPAATFVDADETAQNTNPVICDSSGRASIWLQSSQNYDFAIHDKNDSPLYTIEDVSGAGIITSISSTLNSDLDFNGFSAIFDDNTGLKGPEGTYAIKIDTDTAEPDHLVVTSGTSGAGVTLGSGSSATDSDMNISPKGAGEINLTGPVVNISGNSSSSAEVRLFEDTDNGTNYLSLKAPASLASNTTFTFPATAGTLMIGENNLSEIASASTSRTNLGLGTIATQASSSVSITGGSITGITDLAVADGGTGASTASAARSNLSAATYSEIGQLHMVAGELSNAASVTISDADGLVFGQTMTMIKLSIADFTPVTNAVTLNLTFIDNAGSENTGAADYSWSTVFFDGTSGGNIDTDTSDDTIQLTGDVTQANSTPSRFSADLTIYLGTSSKFASLSGTIAFNGATGLITGQSLKNPSGGPYRGIKLAYSSGNISQGTYNATVIHS